MTNEEQKKKKPAGNPIWLKWMVVAFIGYAAYLHFTGQGPREHNYLKRAEHAATENTEAAKQAEEPVPTVINGIKIGGDIAGTGETAQCGQRATVKVEATLPDGSTLDESDAAQEVNVGLPGSQAAPWLGGVTGMKQGGVRELVVPARLAFDDEALKARNLQENTAIRYKIALTDLSPKLPKASLPFRAVDTVTANKPNSVRCGDKVEIHLDLWGPDGVKLHSSHAGETNKPLMLQVGQAMYFYGLDRGLLGMREGSSRTLVVPPAYLVSFIEADSPIGAVVKTVGGKTVIADVTLLKIDKIP